MATKAKDQSLKDRIRAATIKGTAYKVPEWNATIELRSMSVAQVEKLGDLPDDDDGMVVTLAATCYDPDTGEPLFDNDDAEWLKEQPLCVMEPLFRAAMAASGIDNDRLDAAIESGKGDS